MKRDEPERPTTFSKSGLVVKINCDKELRVFRRNVIQKMPIIPHAVGQVINSSVLKENEKCFWKKND